MIPFSIKSEKINGYIVIKLLGSLDNTTEDSFHTFTKQFSDNIILDCSNLIFLNSHGISSIIALYKRIINEKKDFALYFSHPILDLLYGSKLNKQIHILSNPEELELFLSEDHGATPGS